MPDISQSLIKRLTASGPKRILALDGGGIRGAVTLGFLEAIESQLADRHDKAGLIKKKDFRLSQYFDLIGGTSTGAIIAALLAIGGYTVAEIKTMYRTIGSKIFSDHNGFNLLGHQIYFNGKYNSQPLKDELAKFFGDATLGDNTNKTGLCVIAKRLDTCSTWPVTNNPNSKYFAQNRFYIRDIVRASTAAPSFFEPQIIDVGSGELGVFVDGGMSMMNNPALQLFLVATLKGFKLQWDSGEDKLLIVSIGTGRRNKKLLGDKWKNPNLLDIAQCAPEQFMSDAGEMTELMMHFIGRGKGTLRKIDAEVDDLSDDAINGNKAFSYVRYNVEMIRSELENIGMKELDDAQVTDLMNMDHPKNVDILLKIGEAAAKSYVKDEHFSPIFDLDETSANVSRLNMVES